MSSKLKVQVIIAAFLNSFIILGSGSQDMNLIPHQEVIVMPQHDIKIAETVTTNQWFHDCSNLTALLSAYSLSTMLS